MMWRTLAVLAVLAGLAPSTLQACSCVITGPSGSRPIERHWSDRSQIFVGHVLDVEWTLSSSARQTVRLVTEASWRGPMPDTVTLIVRPHAPCASYTIGSRYLVLADTTGGASPLVTAACDYAVRYASASKKIDSLGPPVWRAPPVGSRALDAQARAFGTPISRTFTDGSVMFIPPSGEGIARFEIGDFSGNQSWRILYAQPGLYQFRITWTDGSSYASYLSMRCNPDMATDRCQSYISFGGLR